MVTTYVNGKPNDGEEENENQSSRNSLNNNFNSNSWATTTMTTTSTARTYIQPEVLLMTEGCGRVCQISLGLFKNPKYWGPAP